MKVPKKLNWEIIVTPTWWTILLNLEDQIKLPIMSSFPYKEGQQ